MKKGLLVVLMLVVVMSMLTGCFSNANTTAEGYLEALKNASATEMEKYVADNATFNINEDGYIDSYSKDEIIANWAMTFAFYPMYTNVQTIYAIEKTTKVDANNSIVTGKYSINFTITDGGLTVSAKLNSSFEFKVSKVDGKWLIVSAEETWTVEETGNLSANSIF